MKRVKETFTEKVWTFVVPTGDHVFYRGPILDSRKAVEKYLLDQKDSTTKPVAATLTYEVKRDA
jgi:hypothetical protein